MGIVKQSRAEDPVDRINTFWTAWIFVSLALIAWCVSLQSQSQLQQDSQLSVEDEQALASVSLPEFTTHCWCPAQFEPSHVSYTNTFCGMAFRDALLKRNKSKSIHDTHWFNEIPLRPVKIPGNITEVTEEPEVPKEIATESAKETRVAAQDNITFSLVVFVLLLKSSYMVARIFEKCLGLLNIDQTIDQALEAQKSTSESRRQELSKELVQCAVRNVRPSNCALCIVFILIKLSCCCLILYAVIHFHSLASADNQVASGKEINHDHLPFDKPYHCFYEIRQMTNKHQYTVQCVSKEISQTNDESRVAFLRSLDAHSALCHVVLAYLIFLLVVNVLSLAGWLCRLAFKGCQPVSILLPPGTCLDLQLTLLMAYDHGGPLVAENLARHVATSAAGGSDLFKMHVDSEEGGM